MLSFLIEKEVKQLLRDPLFSKLLIALPVMTMLIYPWAVSQEIKNVKVDIVDNDRSGTTKKLVEEIDATDYFGIYSLRDSYPQALEDVDEGRADMIVEFCPDFERRLARGEGAEVLIAANAVNGTKGTLGSSYMMSMLGQSTAMGGPMAGNDLSAGAGGQGGGFSVREEYLFNPALDYKVFMIPALIVMLITVICGFFPALNIVNEKEQGTIEQLNVTPVGKVQFILAKMIPLWVAGLLDAGIALLISRWLYGLSPAGSVWTMLAFAAVYIIVVSAFGLTVSNLSNTMQQAIFVMFFFVMILFLMSGMFTPVESMPGWAQVVAAANPLTYFIDVMRSICLKGSRFGELLPQFGALCVFALLFGSAAIFTYKKQG